MSRRTLRKAIILLLTFSLILTITSLFIWNIAYLNPLEKDIEKQANLIKEKLLNNNYQTYKELITTLDDIPNINYSIESTTHEITQGGKKNNNKTEIFSELVEIENKNYLLKVYSNKILNPSEIIKNFFFFYAIMTFVITLVIGIMLERLIIKPINSILSEIKDYKFGTKPKKKKIKNEIDVIQNEFVELTDSLNEKNKEQNRIIASISHDLKTPLTSVIGYSNLMLNKNITKKQIEKYNEQINLKAKNMKEILNTFDEYLVDNTNQSLKLETIKIGYLLKHLHDDYYLDLKSNNIDFVIECDCKEEYIKVDISKIRRIFSNIISNSVRYIVTRGIIKIKVESKNNYFIFTISDNGKGIDEKYINKIFDPFFTTDKGRKISGLGLSICKEFIEMHGGSIKGYNNLGFTVEFTIPKNFNNS